MILHWHNSKRRFSILSSCFFFACVFLFRIIFIVIIRWIFVSHYTGKFCLCGFFFCFDFDYQLPLSCIKISNYSTSFYENQSFWLRLASLLHPNFFCAAIPILSFWDADPYLQIPYHSPLHPPPPYISYRKTSRQQTVQLSVILWYKQTHTLTHTSLAALKLKQL